MKFRVALTPRAKADIARAGRWWRANRPAAPDLLRRELTAARDALATNPELAQRADDPETRRILLPRTLYFLYYEVDRARGLVSILALWHAVRGAKPRL